MDIQDFFGVLLEHLSSSKNRMVTRYYSQNLLLKSRILREISENVLNHPKINTSHWNEKNRNQVGMSMFGQKSVIETSFTSKERIQFLILLDKLTENFDICFAMPDEDLTSQDVQEDHEMYFILKGQCKVMLRNDHGGGRERILKES